MPFYEHKLKAGHAGKNCDTTLIIYNFADSMTQSLKDAKYFPGVKHHNHTMIIGSKQIGESEFVKGILQSAYARRNGDFEIAKLANVIKIIDRIKLKGYDFQSQEGVTLNGFCDTYLNASTKIQPMVEQEYIQWAEDLVDTNTDEQNFGF